MKILPLCYWRTLWGFSQTQLFRLLLNHSIWSTKEMSEMYPKCLPSSPSSQQNGVALDTPHSWRTQVKVQSYKMKSSIIKVEFKLHWTLNSSASRTSLSASQAQLMELHSKPHQRGSLSMEGYKDFQGWSIYFNLGFMAHVLVISVLNLSFMFFRLLWS